MGLQRRIVGFGIMLAMSANFCNAAEPNAMVSVAYETGSSARAIDPSMSYYDMLDIKSDATDAQIKSAYRELAMKYHPDRNQNNKTAEAIFKLIGEAYETLKDPGLRAHYDRNGKQSKPGSPHAAAFLRMNVTERTSFLEHWLWDDNGEKVLEALIDDLRTKAVASTQAFGALMSIHTHEHEHQTGGFLYIRMSAFGAMTQSHPHRSEVVREYFEVLNKVFDARRSRSQQKRRSISGEGGYFVGMAIEAFFRDQALLPEIFRVWFPKMVKMLPKSHSTAWEALLESLASINARFPKDMPRILKIYENALYDLDRPNIQDPKRPVWLYGRTYNTVADGSNVVEGLLLIARLRPEFADRVFQALVRYPKLMASSLARALIRSAEKDEVARKALRVLLSQTYPADQLKAIKSTLEQEEVNLERNSESMSSQEIRQTEEILEMVRSSTALKHTSSSELCGTVFKAAE